MMVRIGQKKMKHNFSSGAKKDLLVIFFVRSLIHIALDMQKDEAEGTIARDRDNKHYKENKRIDKRLQRLLDTIEETVNEIPIPLMRTLSVWINKQLASKVKKVIEKLSHKEVQLEMLALWVLFANFENRKVLMEVYKKFEDPSLYFDDVELLMKVGVSDDTNGDMFLLAYDVVGQIKS